MTDQTPTADLLTASRRITAITSDNELHAVIQTMGSYLPRDRTDEEDDELERLGDLIHAYEEIHIAPKLRDAWVAIVRRSTDDKLRELKWSVGLNENLIEESIRRDREEAAR